MRPLIFLLLVILCPAGAFASTETIYASYKYTLGDNDSKNDARRFAYSEARIRALEKVVSAIESEPRLKEYSLSTNEINAYIGAIIDVRIDNEEFDLSWGSLTLKMTVKAEIDRIPVITTLDIINNDKELKEKIVKKQAELRKMEVKLTDMQKRIAAESNSDRAIYLRKNKTDISINMSENSSMDTSQLACEVAKIQNSINIISNKVIDNVRNGMTKHEITTILGSPRNAFSYYDKNKSVFCENYGKYWIIIDTNSVIGYVPYNNFNGCNANIMKQLVRFDELIK